MGWKEKGSEREMRGRREERKEKVKEKERAEGECISV